MKKIYNQNEFSFVISSISGFTNQTSTELVTKSLLGANTIKYLTPRFGLKGTQQIQVLESTPVFQSGACGWNATGTTTFSQLSLTVCDERLNESLCPKDLYTTYQSLLLKAGQPEEEVPFEEMIMSEKVQQIQKHIEDKIWNASTGDGDCFDGLNEIFVFSGATGVISSSGTTFTAASAYGVTGNPITEVDNMINVLSDDAMSRDDLVVFMSYSNFRLYLQALTKANFFQNYIGGTSITNVMEAVHPNTNIKVVPTYGLNGSGKVVIGPSAYMFYGVDLQGDTEKLDMWWSKDNNEIRIRGEWSFGVAVKTWSDIYYFAVNGIG